ncbi:unnamed protein product [Bursaphelenchus xylophilus]|uniref:(pine wood nematode) hypothetical protein n=1 Tax=Bursaphelenchus xylophilus TaxID=6326 RepID=A0A1I7SSA3_BURXY|nr:unnamed protein product [Bursaphelenchus xylophilus]CAG9097828.1 unnamed protein product [Bursaphelenchus xylophilus]
MNFLAKHFFDYQSFVNLPQKAVQLHKTPYSEAGVDPSAAWAPKNMQVQGKNMSSPGARANRNNIEQRPGCHRHGRPSKLENRRWGERHSDLKEERIIPHKDEWMSSLDGDFKHFDEESDEDEDALELIPRCLRNKRLLDAQLLVIMTLTARLEFVTITIKKIRGLKNLKNPVVRIRHFDGIALVEERTTTLREIEISVKDTVGNGGPSRAPSSPQLRSNHINRVNVQRRAISRQGSEKTKENNEFGISESFLLRVNPNKLNSSYVIIQVFASRFVTAKRPNPLKPEENMILVEEIIEEVGVCVIGASKVSSRGLYHWRQMIKKHGHPVCAWHYLFGGAPKCEDSPQSQNPQPQKSLTESETAERV